MSRTVTNELAASAGRLRTLGLRCTQSRLFVLAVLLQDGGHLSAREIRRRLLDAGGAGDVSTVYRTVERLTELGVLHRVPNGEEAVFGVGAGPHHHAVCERCGAVADVPVTLTAESVRAAQACSGFTVSAVLLTGRCPSCPPAAVPVAAAASVQVAPLPVAEPADRPVAG